MLFKKKEKTEAPKVVSNVKKSDKKQDDKNAPKNTVISEKVTHQTIKEDKKQTDTLETVHFFNIALSAPKGQMPVLLNGIIRRTGWGMIFVGLFTMISIIAKAYLTKISPTGLLILNWLIKLNLFIFLFYGILLLLDFALIINYLQKD